MIENEAFSSAGVGLPVLRVSWFQLSGFGAFGSKVFGFRVSAGSGYGNAH